MESTKDIPEHLPESAFIVYNFHNFYKSVVTYNISIVIISLNDILVLGTTSSLSINSLFFQYSSYALQKSFVVILIMTDSSSFFYRTHVLDYLIDLDIAVDEALERQVNKWKFNDQDHLDAVLVGDTYKARRLENMLWLCARESVFNAMMYV